MPKNLAKNLPENLPENHVHLFEVGPRDGLQNEPEKIAAKDKMVARWPWNAWPDESGLGGRMAWNPQSTSAASPLMDLRKSTGFG